MAPSVQSSSPAQAQVEAVPAPLAALLQRACGTPPALDETSRQAVQEALRADPGAAYALAGEALRLQGELAAARHLIERLKRMHPAPAKTGPTAEDLKRESAAWDALLGTGSRRRQGSAPAATPRASTFEDVGARFLAAHAGKVWAALFVLSAVVVLVKERVIA